MKPSGKPKLFLWLFGVNFFISAFTFGGGYVVIPMIRKYFVEKKKLFGESELLDMAAIAQSSPGAIAINLSALSGFRTAGIAGAVISCIAAITPPILILSVVSTCYVAFRDNALISAVLKGMEAGVGALIVDIVFDMSRTVFKEKQTFLSALVPVAFVASFFFQVNVIWVILISIVICFLSGWLGAQGKEKVHV